MEGGNFEGSGYDSRLVSPEEVMASDSSEAIATLDTEIERLEGEMAATLSGEGQTDVPVDGARAQQLTERLAQLRIQRAQLLPVEPEPEDD